MPRRSRAWYWLSLLILVGLLAGYARYRDVQGQYRKYLESGAEVQRLREELESRRAEEARLQRSVENLRSDPVEWEAAIRRNQGLVREGEKVFRIETAP
jgi:cell division protein FtsB